MRRLSYTIFTIFLLFGCDPKKKNEGNSQEKKIEISVENYNLESPDHEYSLPNKLKEISGLSTFSDNEIICVNDEQGKIFVYDFNKEKITNTLEFGKAADYEGVEIVGNIVYVLNSNGKIKAFNMNTLEAENINCSQSEVDEYEGLGYDNSTNSLLLAAKEMKGNKKIYSYDLGQKSLNVRFEISENLIDKNGFGREFKPSGIAIHPTTGHIFILASSGKKLLVLDADGTKIKQYNLAEKLFPQPEGICFNTQGDLFISNEGKTGQSNILVFKNNIQLQ
jgi:uncharacterized protein YjiK